MLGIVGVIIIFIGVSGIYLVRSPRREEWPEWTR